MWLYLYCLLELYICKISSNLGQLGPWSERCNWKLNGVTGFELFLECLFTVYSEAKDSVPGESNSWVTE